jgi:hypothetical protein
MERFLPERSKYMTDWDLITGYIRNAMEAVDRAHEVVNGLREKPTAETLDQFRLEMEVLIERLTRLQTVLDNQEAFALDEVADWLSQAFTGQPSEYRRTPRMQV